MLKLLLAAAIVSLAPAAFAQAPTPLREMPAGSYSIDPAHASVTWRVNHLGLSNYTARFTGIKALLTLDPVHPEMSKVTATIDPVSIQTDYPKPKETDFNAELGKGEKWFNAGKYPSIVFESTSAEFTGEKTGTLTGNLTMLGVTKPITLNVTFNGAYLKMPHADKPAVGFSATATLKRSDWGLEEGVPYVGDEVTLLIEAEFHKK